MSYSIIVIFSFSILLAGVIGAIRLKNINANYYPFLYLIWIACLNEILSFILSKTGHYTSVNNNIYVLLESVLITWLFKKNSLFKNNQVIFSAIIIFFLGIWLFESLCYRSINEVSLYFRIIYSFTIVLMSINQINLLISVNKGNILKNATFLLCIGFVVYFTFKVLIEAFWIYGLSSSTAFQKALFDILTWINLFTNLIYALAILWMPKRQAFILPF